MRGRSAGARRLAFAALSGAPLLLGACESCSKDEARPRPPPRREAGVFGMLEDGRAPTGLAHVKRDAAALEVPSSSSRPPECRLTWDNAQANGAPTDWLTIAAQSSATVRIGETGREIRFEGPAVVRPCAPSGNVDVAVLASGSAAVDPTAGGDAWVATPCGALRWASGAQRVAVAKDDCKIQSSLGTAHLWTPPDVRVAEEDGGAPAPRDAGAGEAWRRLDGRQVLRLAIDRAPGRAARAVDACERAARDAASTAAALQTGADPASIGKRTYDAMQARMIARASCGVAAARLHATGDDAALLARTQRAEASAFGDALPDAGADAAPHGR